MGPEDPYEQLVEPGVDWRQVQSGRFGSTIHVSDGFGRDRSFGERMIVGFGVAGAVRGYFFQRSFIRLFFPSHPYGMREEIRQPSGVLAESRRREAGNRFGS